MVIDSRDGKFVLIHDHYSKKMKGIIDREGAVIYGGRVGMAWRRCTLSHILPSKGETKAWLARNLFITRNSFLCKPKSMARAVPAFYISRYGKVNKEINHTREALLRYKGSRIKMMALGDDKNGQNVLYP